MNFEQTYINFKEQEHIQPMELHNKIKFYTDLSNLEDSWTGRVDAWLSNTFVHEAIRLVINSIVLFEKGYFDCAYYSLRQSLEVSTTMVYLTELDEEMKENELSKWKRKSDFPMYGQMIKFLADNENVFADMKKKMSDYFSELQKLKKRLNKHVHKQGFNTFYVSRNHVFSRNKDRLGMVVEFEECLKGCIGAVAVFRLAIDPFPILLMDYEIFSRTGDVLSGAFSEDFVQRYISENTIGSYKDTLIYRGHYENFIKGEKRLPSVLDVVKHKYINLTKIDEILSQMSLLSKIDCLAVNVARISESISRIYAYDGLLVYSTTTKSVREEFGFSGLMFMEVKNSGISINVPFEEAFLTYVRLYDEDFYIEHNHCFDTQKLNYMVTKIQTSLKSAMS